jgi:predicted AAA+ superfamily ATPase
MRHKNQLYIDKYVLKMLKGMLEKGVVLAMMERFAAYLKKWLNKSRRKPIVLRGARQVGKSTLVHQFALTNGLNLHEINLERHLELNAVFKTLDMDNIIREIEAVVGANIQKPGSILFLDEIQATPYALQALRYFYEERPDLPVISAGSLLEFTLLDHNFSMPVGRIEYYHLGPMTFREFLVALEPNLEKYIASFSMNKEIPDSAHKKLLKRQREYIFTGGMPEAVLAYKETQSITDVSDVHRSIVETYQDDFSKYAKHRELGLMQQVFRQIPRNVGKKVKYSNISREHRSKDVKTVVDLLTQARICHKVFHSHCSGLPLYSDINENAYKLIFMDIGIVNYISGNDWITIQSFIDSDLVNEGPLAEQFIGQHLATQKNEAPRMCYWLREGKSANAEVDYVIAQGNLILPIEVKAGKSGSLKSLHQFAFQKKAELVVRFDLNKPGIQNVQHLATTMKGTQPVQFRLLSLPLYLIEILPHIIDQLRLEGR